MLERVQKIMAAAGIDSRRNCEELIAEGRVKVNGAIIKLGQKADAEKDAIVVDGKRIGLEQKVYVLLNKPKGYVTTVAEQFGMPTVMHLVRIKQRVFPVGRLDIDAQGLVFLTNDGDLANLITHPRYETKKTYIVKLNRKFADFERLKRGVFVEGRSVKVWNAKKFKETEVELTIHEGRKHIVKNLFEKLGYRVIMLKRISIGILKLGTLNEGEWRLLGKKEVEELKKSVKKN
jgi:23S rRNA pseudouridine2605 synthase